MRSGGWQSGGGKRVGGVCVCGKGWHGRQKLVRDSKRPEKHDLPGV